MHHNTIVFDLDGTLLDTLGDLRDSVNHALAAHGLPVRTLDEVRTFVGNGVRRLVERAAGLGQDDPRFEALFHDFRQWYAVHCNDTTHPYEGIPELLASLKERGGRLAVVSNKEDREVRLLAERYFPGIFACTIGERQGVARKPAPDSLLKAVADLGSDIRHAVYVGDSEVDVQTARNAGMDLVSVTWGYRSRERLVQEGAAVFIDRPGQLPTII